jgi:hypothetical protein
MPSHHLGVEFTVHFAPLCKTLDESFSRGLFSLLLGLEMLKCSLRNMCQRGRVRYVLEKGEWILVELD